MRSLSRSNLLLALLFCVAQVGIAQDMYTVRAGVFRDVKAADFSEVNDLGYVYNLEDDKAESSVYLGQFSNRSTAIEVLNELGRRGFRNAEVLTLPPERGQPLRMIQFAFHGINQAIPWKRYESLGQLHVLSVDGSLKVLTGPYATTEAAKVALTIIKQQGYADAFIKPTNSTQLIPIGFFETGLKQPFITLKTRSPAAASATPTPPSTNSPQTERTTPNAGQAPVIAPAPAPAPAAAPSAKRPPAPAAFQESAATEGAVDLPAIDGAIKRHSAAELQMVLKEKGFYDGEIDGYYGPGTASAYRRAWEELPVVRKYRLLSGAAPTESESNSTTLTQWAEVVVLLTIADDLSAGNTNLEAASVFARQRNSLFGARENLNPDADSRTKDWASSIWENLNLWATEDPLHAQIFTAFRVSYHQSQARIEQHYVDSGFSNIEARDLAIAMMQNLTGAQLDRFL